MKNPTTKTISLTLLFLLSTSLTIGQIYFGSERIISNVCGSASSVFACDIDGDNDIDVLAAAAAENKIVWYENNGSGIFGPQQIITSSARTAVDVFACDMDGDLDMDVFSASFGDNKIAWYENDGNGNFGAQQVISDSAYGAQSVYACDFDGDMDIDVLSASINDNKIVVYKNDGNEGFDLQIVVSDTAAKANFAYAADIEQDGDLDILYTALGTHEIGLYINDGLGYFESRPGIPCSDVRSAYVSDIDKDGDNDIIAAEFGWDEVSWYENYDDEHFSPAQVISSSASGVLDVFSADLDGDMDDDVLSASYHDNKIAWYENDGAGNFGSQQVVSTSAIHANSVYAIDIDGDGDIDLLSASQGDHKIAWYENSPPPEITEEPASQAGCENSDIHIQLSANFAESYQWQLDAGSGFTDLSENAVYAGVHTNDLLITGATADLSGNAYRCIVTNQEGESISESATLTINSTAVITSQPAESTTVCHGEPDITLEVIATGATAYQWYFEGNEIANATGSTLSITTDPGNSGNYYCVIQCGGVKSNDAAVLVQQATAVTSQPPINTTVCEDDTEIQLSVEAIGTGTITYQWNYEGAEISGATNSMLNISANPENSGTYHCTVESECGSDITDDAEVLIQAATILTAQPPANMEACEGDTEIQLSVEADGTGTITFQWNYNGEEIPGATNPALGISTDPEESGVYSCTITGECGVDVTDDTEVRIHPSYFSIESKIICSGTDYTFPDNTTQTNITSQVVYTSHLVSVSGCDSIIETTLDVHNVDNSVTADGLTLTASNGTALSYQWIDCNNNYAPVSEATNQQFTPTTDGDYAVIINDGTCADTSICYSIIGVGIQDHPAHCISLYPNPTTGKITIEGAYIQEIELININGQSLMIFEINKEKAEIDLSAQNSGLYFIKVSTGTGIVMEKVEIY
jgi:hypothetical protein